MKPKIQTTKSAQKQLYLKIGFILLLILLLMIPNLLVKDLILERKSLDEQVKSEIAQNWGPAQSLAGPILSIPYTKNVIFDGKTKVVQHKLRIVPEDIKIDVQLQTEERKKGIYKAILYNAEHQLNGNFVLPNESDFGSNLNDIQWEKATIDLGFTSAASLDDIVTINWNGEDIKMESGASSSVLFQSGIHANIALDTLTRKYDFSTSLGINGSKSIHYLPIANNTSVNMNSSWDSPGFTGLPSPQTREISSEGFNAEWKATEYNRPFKNKWVDGEVQILGNNAFFGVNLVQTVSHYQKNMRSAKYALLILCLSFLVFFFFEILKGNKIHPIQYIFIGLALSTFYILLLSFSEHVGFNTAYIIASVSTIGLISWYSRFVLKQGSNVIILTLILAVLYTYIFTLLQMEDLALLVGSVGLFTALFITMYLSRNTNWYAMGSLTLGSSPKNELIDLESNS